MNKQTDFLYEALGIKPLVKQLEQDEHRWANKLPQDIHSLLDTFKHGDLENWLGLLQSLPEVENLDIQLDKNAITLTGSTLNSTQHAQFLASLHGLKPWRKGPYQLFGIDIDTEWRSDRKWQRMESHLDLNGKTVGLLGLAFKPNTDDIRSAASLDLVDLLKARGCHIRAHDPAAMENFKTLHPDLEYCGSPYEACEGVDLAILVTEWNQYRQLDFNWLTDAMAGKAFLDCRNVYDRPHLEKFGFKYDCFGRADHTSGTD